MPSKKRKREVKTTSISRNFAFDDLDPGNKVYGYNFETDSWHCLECGDDMGPNNPRQLCGKHFCHNQDKK